MRAAPIKLVSDMYGLPKGVRHRIKIPTTTSVMYHESLEVEVQTRQPQGQRGCRRETEETVNYENIELYM